MYKIPELVVDTYIGSGVSGFVDGVVATALLSSPSGVAVDSNGNIWLTDTNSVRMFNASIGITLILIQLYHFE